jgi:transposase
MHGFTAGEIAKLAARADKPYTRQALTAVVMTLQGIPAETTAETLGCSRVPVWRHVHRWNEQGIEAAADHRGGSKSSFTEEMLADVDDAVRNRCPKDHGYYKNRWDTRVLQRYILDTYGREYSYERIRQILHKLGHSHKRSTKRPTRPDKQAQDAFKKGWLN